MKLKTKDELLIATAYESLSPNITKISKYLNLHNIYLTDKQITTIYTNLKNESQTNGYTKVTTFCKDKRYLEAIEELKTLKQIYYDILENKIDYNQINIPQTKPYKIGNPYKDIIKPKTQIILSSSLQTPEIYNKIEIKDNNLQIEPQNINKHNKKIIESPKNLKETKRYVLRMNEDEKLLDDFFDYLDIICEYKSVYIVQHKLNFKFIKDLKNNKPDIKDIHNQYNSIMYKIKNKKHEKEKGVWKYEIKIIIGYIISIIGYENEFIDILNNVEGNSLQVSVMNILMKLQDVIMRVNDKKIVYKCDELKKGVSCFCDYYKK